MEKDKYLSEVISDIVVFNSDKACGCNIISQGLLKYLDDSTYGGILYSKYRCKSVHEGKFDELWDGISGRRLDQIPFYMDIQDDLPDFSIPPEFIIETFRQCLIGLRRKNAIV